MATKGIELVAHLSKFVSVGVLNSVVGYATFVALQLSLFRDIDFGYFFALAGSYCVAVPLAFLLYRRFVFTTGAKPAFQMARFSSVYIASIAVNAVGLGILVERYGWNELLAQLVAMALAAGTSYFGHRFISFRP